MKKRLLLMTVVGEAMVFAAYEINRIEVSAFLGAIGFILAFAGLLMLLGDFIVNGLE